MNPWDNLCRALVLLLLCGGPVLSAATVNWTRIVATSDGGGVWNTVAGSGNWYIWVTRDPISNASPAFINGVDPAINIALSPGDNTFTLYRDTYANQDAGTTFSLLVDSTPVTLVVTQSPAPWGTTAGFAPALVPTLPSVTVGDTTIRVTGYRWLSQSVYSRNLIGTTGFGPDGTGDLIGEISLTVVPEPGALCGLLLGTGGLLLRRRGGTR